MDIYCRKLDRMLVPDSEQDTEKLQKIKTGEPVRVTITRPRNYQFFKKWWALVDYAYDCWEPPENQVGQKNKERFRKDLVILAGFYDQSIRLDGSARVEAKSISFANMDEERFEDLYNKTIDVILKYVLTNYTKADLNSVVDQIMSFY